MDVLIVKVVLSIIVGVLLSLALLRAKVVNKKDMLKALIALFVFFLALSFIIPPLFIAFAVPSVICSLLIIIVGENEKRVEIVVWSGGVLLIAMIFILFVIFFNYNPVIGSEKVMLEKIDLVAVEDNTMVSGHYYMFDSSIDTVKIYEYYYITASGGSLYDYVRATSMPVFEEPRLDGFIGTYTIRTFKEWPEEYRIIYGIREGNELADNGRFREMHVPIGTIKRRINIDLSSQEEKNSKISL